MRSAGLILISLFLFTTLQQLNAEEHPKYHLSAGAEEPSIENTRTSPCISATEYSLIESRSAQSRRALNLSDVPQSGRGNSITTLSWPLRAASALTDCSYYHISAYVDQNTASGATQDYNCGTNTYDGHRGTDISIWPFNFYKMDNDLVEVIAAAPGIIIDKNDGEYDRNCAASTMTANYVLIQHADGSHALYWHMKNGSILTKAIGQSVAEGEKLGIVGSSGSSSGPHLHFEIWSGSTVSTRIDPYAGSCNSLNANSWWTNQKPYKETGILKASVHTTDAVFPGCPITETSNESTSFQVPFQGAGLPAGYAKFYVFLRNEIVGLTATMTILNPNGSTFNTWTYTTANEAKVRAWSWSKVLPTNPGLYTFQTTYNGITCSSDFSITSSTGISSFNHNSDLKVYSNTYSGKIIFKTERSLIKEIELYDLLGAKIYGSDFSEQIIEINPTLPGGVYFYRLRDADRHEYSGKIIFQ